MIWRGRAALCALAAFVAGCAASGGSSGRINDWLQVGEPYSVRTRIANHEPVRNFLVRETRRLDRYCILRTTEHLEFADGTSKDWKPILVFARGGGACVQPDAAQSVALVWPELQDKFLIAASSVDLRYLHLRRDAGEFAEHFFKKLMMGAWQARSFHRSSLRRGLYELTLTKEGEGVDITLHFRIDNGEIAIEDVSASSGP